MKRRAAILVVAVVVPLTIVAIVVIARRDGGTHAPARLPIVAERRSAQGSDAANIDAGPLAPYGQIIYKAGPDLPALDGSARAYRVAPTDLAATMRRLVDALGLHGEPSDNGDGGLVLNDGAAQLVVTTRSWSYSREQGGAISSGVAVACPPDAPTCTPDDTAPPPTRPANLPSEDGARAASLALLDNIGVDTRGAAVSIDDGITRWFVSVAPVVDGNATEGFGASVVVGDNGVIDAASGILGTVTPADEYPLIGTAAGIERLNAGYRVGPPVPGIGEAPEVSSVAGSAGGSASASSASAAPGSAPPGSAAPAEPVEPPAVPIPESPESSEAPSTDTFPPPTTQEIVLTSAERILLYASSVDGQEGWLVPAYRFTTADGTGPSVIAVDDQFLTPPDAIQPAVKSAGESAPAVASDEGR